MNEDWQGFISFKNLDANGKPSPDSELARSVHEFLAAQGLRVFFSNVSLERLGVSMYKKQIDSALDRASFMVVVGSSGDNLAQEWVRYEWESFYNDILSGIKPHARLFAYVDGVAMAELPRTIRQSQVFFHGPGEMQRLYNFIANGLNLRPEDPDATEAVLRDCVEKTLRLGESWAIGSVEVWLSRGGRRPIARINTDWKQVTPAVMEQIQKQGWHGTSYQWGRALDRARLWNGQDESAVIESMVHELSLVHRTLAASDPASRLIVRTISRPEFPSSPWYKVTCRDTWHSMDIECLQCQHEEIVDRPETTAPPRECPMCGLGRTEL